MMRRLAILLCSIAVLSCDQTPPTEPDQLANSPQTTSTASVCTTTPGMVAWWPGEGDGTDRVGSSDGTLHGPVGFAAGRVGSAFSLDGVNTFVDLGNAPALHVSSGPFTIAVWVKFNTLTHPPGANTPGTPEHDMSILDKMSPTGLNQNGWRLLKQTDHRVWFCLGGGGSNQCGNSSHTLFGTTAITAGVWYHVAVTLSDSTMALYINGAVVDSRALPGFLDDHSTNMRIGSYALENAIANALIDEVQVYSRELSAAEVAALHGAGESGVCHGAPDITVPATLYGIVNQRVTLPLSIGGNAAGPFTWRVHWRAPYVNPLTTGSAPGNGNVSGVYRKYTSVGSYTARTIVTASTGDADTASTAVLIVDPTAVPTAVVSGDLSIDEGQPVLLDGSASTDPNGMPLRYAWRFNGTLGTDTTISSTPVRGSYPYRLIVRNAVSLADTAIGTVVVNNVAPDAVWTHPAPAYENTTSKLRISGITDAEADLDAGIQASFDCGDGYGAYSLARGKTCPGFPDQGTYTRGVRLMDQLGAVREFRDTVTVANLAPTIASLYLSGSGSNWAPNFIIRDATGDSPWTIRYYVDGVRQGPAYSTTVQGVGYPGSSLTATSGQLITVRVTDKDGASRSARITVP
jgi:hypothetical protein